MSNFYRQKLLFEMDNPPETETEGRDVLDRFYTPEWASEALLDFLGNTFAGDVWDPCCGKDWGGRVFRRGYRVTSYLGTDIDPEATPVFWKRGAGILQDDLIPPIDFITADLSYFDADWIVTNPPYEVGSLTAADFVEKALRHPTASVAMLVTLRWLEACKDRRGIFQDDPPTDVLVIGRVQFIGSGKKSNNLPSVWCIWDRQKGVEGTHLHWRIP